MPTYLKKGTFGRMVETEGADDPDLVEVRLTPEEYSNLWRRIRRAEEDADEAEQEAEKTARESRAQARRDLAERRRQMEEEAAKEIWAVKSDLCRSEEKTALLETQLAKAEAELQRETELNVNLIRIARERANQARGIRPKTVDGFVVLDSRQVIEQYAADLWDSDEHAKAYVADEDRAVAVKLGYLSIVRKKASVWVSVLQTPYSVSLPAGHVKELVEREWDSVLHDLSVDQRVSEAYNGTYLVDATKNLLYRWLYRANMRTGYWEITLFTSGWLIIPEHRRLATQSTWKNSTQKKGKGEAK